MGDDVIPNPLLEECGNKKLVRARGLVALSNPDIALNVALEIGREVNPPLHVVKMRLKGVVNKDCSGSSNGVGAGVQVASEHTRQDGVSLLKL